MSKMPNNNTSARSGSTGIQLKTKREGKKVEDRRTNCDKNEGMLKAMENPSEKRFEELINYIRSLHDVVGKFIESIFTLNPPNLPDVPSIFDNVKELVKNIDGTKKIISKNNSDLTSNKKLKKKRSSRIAKPNPTNKSSSSDCHPELTDLDMFENVTLESVKKLGEKVDECCDYSRTNRFQLELEKKKINEMQFMPENKPENCERQVLKAMSKPAKQEKKIIKDISKPERKQTDITDAVDKQEKKQRAITEAVSKPGYKQMDFIEGVNRPGKKQMQVTAPASKPERKETPLDEVKNMPEKKLKDITETVNKPEKNERQIPEAESEPVETRSKLGGKQWNIIEEIKQRGLLEQINQKDIIEELIRRNEILRQIEAVSKAEKERKEITKAASKSGMKESPVIEGQSKPGKYETEIIQTISMPETKQRQIIKNIIRPEKELKDTTEVVNRHEKKESRITEAESLPERKESQPVEAKSKLEGKQRNIIDEIKQRGLLEQINRKDIIEELIRRNEKLRQMYEAASKSEKERNEIIKATSKSENQPIDEIDRFEKIYRSNCSSAQRPRSCGSRNYNDNRGRSGSRSDSGSRCGCRTGSSSQTGSRSGSGTRSRSETRHGSGSFGGSGIGAKTWTGVGTSTRTEIGTETRSRNDIGRRSRTRIPSRSASRSGGRSRRGSRSAASNHSDGKSSNYMHSLKSGYGRLDYFDERCRSDGQPVEFPEKCSREKNGDSSPSSNWNQNVNPSDASKLLISHDARKELERDQTSEDYNKAPEDYDTSFLLGGLSGRRKRKNKARNEYQLDQQNSPGILQEMLAMKGDFWVNRDSN